MRQNTLVNGLSAITAGTTATARLTPGRRYHGLTLFTTSGSTPAACVASTIIGEIRLIVGTKTIRKITAAQILAIAALNKITVPTGELPIFFSEPWRASVMGEEATSWDLTQIPGTPFIIQIDMLTGTTNPGVVIVEHWDKLTNVDQNKKPFLEIVYQSSLFKNVATGDQDITEIDIDHFIQRILFTAGSGITKALVVRDGETVHELTKTQNDDMLNDHGLVGSAFDYALVFDYTQQVTDALSIAKSLDVRVTSGGTQTLTALIERRKQDFNS